MLEAPNLSYHEINHAKKKIADRIKITKPDLITLSRVQFFLLFSLSPSIPIPFLPKFAWILAQNLAKFFLPKFHNPKKFGKKVDQK